MAKLILLSVIMSWIVLPMLFATRPKPKKVLRVILGVIVVFTIVWAQLCLKVYPAIVPLD